MTYNSLSRFDTSVVDRGALSFLGRLMAGREDSTECLFEDLIEDRNLNGLISFGSLLTFFSPEGWKTYRFLSSDTEKGLQFSDNWEEFGSGTAAVGNCYNVTEY